MIPDKSASQKLETAESGKTVERNVVINGTYIRVKSVFGNIPLEKALMNIAKRKLAVSEKNDGHN